MPTKKSLKKTTKSSKLRKKKQLNWKLAIPIIGVIAAVGGFVVYRSFAATSYRESARGYWNLANGGCRINVSASESRTLLSGNKEAGTLVIGYGMSGSNCSKHYRIITMATRFAYMRDGRQISEDNKKHQGGLSSSAGIVGPTRLESRYGGDYSYVYKYTNIDLQNKNNGKCYRYLARRNTSGGKVKMTYVGVVRCGS